MHVYVRVSTCIYIYMYTHTHTIYIHIHTQYIQTCMINQNTHTAATIAASVATYVASSVSSTTTTSSTTSLSGALGVVKHAQFVAIAGKVGNGGTNAGRRQEESAQPEENSQLSSALSWINFHWIDLTSVTECVSVDGTDL
jgi:hypothetical protein